MTRRKSIGANVLRSGKRTGGAWFSGNWSRSILFSPSHGIQSGGRGSETGAKLLIEVAVEADTEEITKGEIKVPGENSIQQIANTNDHRYLIGLR